MKRQSKGSLYLSILLLNVWILCLSTGCSRESLLPNQKESTENPCQFIGTEWLKYGGKKLVPYVEKAPKIDRFFYSEDKDGFQFLCFGNYAEDLCDFFQSTFGAASTVSTNEQGVVGFVFVPQKAGLFVACSVDETPYHGPKREFTLLAVSKAPFSGSGFGDSKPK